MNRFHIDILASIRELSGTPTQHTFSDGYLGNNHPRYAINAPTMRLIAKDWIKTHKDVDAITLSRVLTSLVNGKSSTEKCMAGVLLDYASPSQRQFDPHLFEKWLDHLVGWAEVDTLCTGKYTTAEIPAQWTAWKKILGTFSKSSNINKRRASLVLLCSPLRNAQDDRLAGFAIKTIDRLKHEKEILITKAISWVLRCMEKHHRQTVEQYVAANKNTLPSIAVRETLAKLHTGTKTKRKSE